MNKEMAAEIFNDFIELTNEYTLMIKAYDSGIREDKDGNYYLNIARCDSLDTGHSFDIPTIETLEEWDSYKPTLKLILDNDKEAYNTEYPKL